MANEVELVEVPGMVLASVALDARAPTIGACIGQGLGEVWAWLRTPECTLTPDSSVVVYLGKMPGPVEVGVRVDRAFDEVVGGIRCVHVAGGPAARTLHVGPYDRLGDAWNAVMQAIAAAGRQPGTGWEVYGDHDDDPSKLETEVVVLLE